MKILRKLQNMTFVALLAVFGAGSAYPAFADTVGVDKDSTPRPQITSDLSLRVEHKNPYSEDPSDPRPLGGVSGFTFVLERFVDVDVTTQAGMDQAKGMKAEDVAPERLMFQASAVTDAEGTAFFAKLPAGLYWVTAKTPDDPAHRYPQPQPFLLVLPMLKVGEEHSQQWADYTIIAVKSVTPTPPTPPTPPAPSTPPETPTSPKPVPNWLPKTGVTVAGIGIVAMGAIMIGVVLAKQRREKDVVAVHATANNEKVK